ncbi:MAG: serine/threonine protein kinase [Ferruginibacter sp.]|nr:serine/threonine protein kinase [Ferruginibacter sp.]
MSTSHELVKEVAGYHLAERIGSGGMGEVYKAYNPSLNRFAAVKILNEEIFAGRFKNEANIQASVNHPNIARLYEYTSCGNKLCIVMEYVEGDCLDVIRRRNGKLSSAETENIIRQIVSALAYLHSKEIMHRDIKPQNFKVQPDGTVKMLDFGIAKNKNSPKLTQAGFVVGTMDYLAPEQFNQQAALSSDIWALAVMAYELVTGYMPFESSNPVALQASICKGMYTSPALLCPDISEKLVTLIDKSLKVNPANRISAAGLENLLGKSSHSIRTGIHVNNKKILLISGIAIILLLVFLVWMNTDDKVIDQKKVDSSVEENIKNEPGVKANTVLINTPGINHAEIILNDGERKKLPYSVSGKEGELFEFTIHAEGYKDKKVEVQITPRRSSFEYNLEKINY